MAVFFSKAQGLYMKVTTVVERKKVLSAVEKAARLAYLQAGYMVQREAQASMELGFGVASIAPHPPNVQKRHLAPSIKVAMIERGARGICIVGPTARSDKGFNYPAILEYGGRNIAKRPYMKPALHKVLKKIPQLFKGLPISAEKANEVALEQSSRITWR